MKGNFFANQKVKVLLNSTSFSNFLRGFLGAEKPRSNLRAIAEVISLLHPDVKRDYFKLPPEGLSNSDLEKWKEEQADYVQDSLYERYRVITTTKGCTIDNAAHVITLMMAYEQKVIHKNDTLREKQRVFQKLLQDNNNTDTWIGSYLIASKKEKEINPIDNSSLHGLWGFYAFAQPGIKTSDTFILFRGADQNNYLVASDKQHQFLVFHHFFTESHTQSISIHGRIEGHPTFFGFQGTLVLPENETPFIKGQLQTTTAKEVRNFPIVMVNISRDIHDIRVPTKEDALSQSMQTYVALLSEKGSDFFNLIPRGELTNWLQAQIRTMGREGYHKHKRLFTGQQWISLSRHTRKSGDICIHEWYFTCSDVNHRIEVKRISKPDSGIAIETLKGELTYFNNRFWVEFSFKEKHKIMFLRFDEEDTESGAHFLAMGSVINEDHPGDLGDMVTEIVLPKRKIPAELLTEPIMSYDVFKEIKGISIDLKLYLNHKDHNILSFENPDSIRSKLNKQKDAIPFQGSYLVYVYNRYAEKHRRLIRYTLDIDQLAVASLRKTFRREPEKIHLFKGLAEEFNDNLHIIFEYDKTIGAPEQPQKLLQEIQLMVDSTPAYEDLNLLTGVLSDTDYAQNPRSMACVLVKTEEYTVADNRRQELVKVAIQKGFQPEPYCPNDTDEYALLDQLLSHKLSGWLEQRFGNSLNKELIKEHGFLPYYFNSLGGVFYSGKD